MSILLSLLLAQARVLPEIDRRTLDTQARAEAQRTRRPVTPTAAPRRTATAAATPRRPVQQAAAAVRRPVQQAAAPSRRPVQQAAIVQPRRTAQQTVRTTPIRRAAGGPLDLAEITTICRAAGNQASPASFIATLSRAYSLSAADSQSLRTSCAAYLAGRDDARTNN